MYFNATKVRIESHWWIRRRSLTRNIPPCTSHIRLAALCVKSAIGGFQCYQSAHRKPLVDTAAASYSQHPSMYTQRQLNGVGTSRIRLVALCVKSAIGGYGAARCVAGRGTTTEQLASKTIHIKTDTVVRTCRSRSRNSTWWEREIEDCV